MENKKEIIVQTTDNNNFTIPTYGTERSAGADLYNIEDIELSPFVPTLAKTGLKVKIPKGTELQIRPRSGNSLNYGITILNTPGTIDEDYRGEIGVILCWNGFINHKKSDFTVNKNLRLVIPAGSRIAQAVLSPVIHAEYVLGDIDETERGEGGFGHTGVK